MSCMYVLVFQKKTLSGIMNRLNSLKYVQYFNVYKKKKMFSLQLFRTHTTLQNILKIKECILTNY